MNDVPSRPAAPVSPSAATPPGPDWRRRGCLFLTGAVLLAALLSVLYVWIALSFDYSEGERAGYVQKYSKKGWVCKTWEGELAMVNLPGAMPEVFRFTVRDAAVAEQINQTLGQRVVLRYEQHLGIPTTCFGETDYFVVGVRPVEE
ncbi:MAG TPA: hypothetical protein VHN15_05280 [Thermoanaerobaculia bacterium]|nr:hypothetical protein [Thermoanaerobaculia bacterium]